ARDRTPSLPCRVDARASPGHPRRGARVLLHHGLRADDVGRHPPAGGCEHREHLPPLRLEGAHRRQPVPRRPPPDAGRRHRGAVADPDRPDGDLGPRRGLHRLGGGPPGLRLLPLRHAPRAVHRRGGADDRGPQRRGARAGAPVVRRSCGGRGDPGARAGDALRARVRPVPPVGRIVASRHDIHHAGAGEAPDRHRRTRCATGPSL
ncbi:MAG: hypothetical protein AVDCRST_MAG20-2612, partial [uncultured Acidimicrobiales bacterium]